jgi:ribosomal protein S18 acetylase RimI-like enzyme
VVAVEEVIDRDVALVDASLDESEAEGVSVKAEVPSRIAGDGGHVVDPGTIGRHTPKFGRWANNPGGDGSSTAIRRRILADGAWQSTRMRELDVRPFEAPDRDAILAVHEAAFRAAAIEFEPDSAIDEELRNVTETYLQTTSPFLVGVLDGDVVATGGYRPRSDGVAEVGHLRVHPAYQRRGYARELMAALEDRAHEEGIERFVLETHEDLPAARALYEDMGYEVTDREPHAVTGDEMIHYAKDL